MVLNRNLPSLALILFLILCLIFCVTRFITSLAKNKMIKAEIAAKYQIIANFIRQSKMPVSKESVAALKGESDKLQAMYEHFKTALTSPLNEAILEEDLEPLKFKERLIQVQKRIREDAKKYNLALPESMGFAKYETELTQPSEISLLVKKLKVLEGLIHAMRSSGVESLSTISFGDIDPKIVGAAEKPRQQIRAKEIMESRQAEPDLEKDAMQIQTGELPMRPPSLELTAKPTIEESDIYFYIPTSFTIVCTNTALIGFLYRLRTSPYIFIVEDLDIKLAEKGQDAQERETTENRLQVNLSVKAMALR